MPDPASAKHTCGGPPQCWWWSSDPGERTGYCYDTDKKHVPAAHTCNQWTKTRPVNV